MSENILFTETLAALAILIGAGCAPSSDIDSFDPDRGDLLVDVCAPPGPSGNGQCDPGCDPPDSDCTQAEFDRASLVVAEIEAFNAGLSAADRDIKYCRMATSPFSFFRGSNHLFWRDFAGDSRFTTFGGPDTRIWVQGDLHTQNYGSFDDDNGVVVYDLNDFDEAVLADYQWDVWRMAVSIALVADESGGFSAAEVAGFIDSFSEAYLDAIASYRGNDRELAARIDETTAYGRLDEFLGDVEASNSRATMLGEWTNRVDGVRRFDFTHPDLDPADVPIIAEIMATMPDYVLTTGGDLATIAGYFTVKDVARRLNAGTGSLGVPRYYVLIEGASSAQGDDRILDVKRQGPPSAYPHLSATELSLLYAAATGHAERAVAAYRALLADVDDHLGWMSLLDGDYSVRERSPYKDSFATDTLDTVTRFTNLAEQWGTILAAAHARSDQDHRADLIPYSFDRNVDVRTDGKHSQFRAQVRDLAISHADQVVYDYRAFLALLVDPASCTTP